MLSHLLDGALLRKALLELLLQFLPGAQGLLHAQEVGKLLQPRVREVFSKMIHTLSVNWEEFLRDKRETVTPQATQISANIKYNILILKYHLE